MTDPQIRSYLQRVQSSLHVPRTRRRRVLEEIESHIHDGSIDVMRAGASRSEAVAQVIAELGPPDVVGAAFADDTPPVSAITGVRRWLPLVLPVILFALALAGIVWTITLGVRDGWTFGAQLSTWWYGRTAVIGALLVYGAAFSIRRADRDATWRWAAWACTGCVVAYLLLEYASRLRLIVT